MERMVYGPRLLALSSLRHCMVRTILLGGFYLCIKLSASILELSSARGASKSTSAIEQWKTWGNILPVLDQNEREDHYVDRFFLGSTNMSSLTVCRSVAVRELQIDFGRFTEAGVTVADDGHWCTTAPLFSFALPKPKLFKLYTSRDIS
jgi:hypothetical protein